MASQAEHDAMRRALALADSPGALRGPNPRVGAVLLDPDGSVISEGFHRGAGTPHAEVEALRLAGYRAKDSTLVVTLEPCDHVGRTGRCSVAVIDAGVARVVYAQSDQSARGRGGADSLRAARIDVEGGVLEAEAKLLNELWTFSVRHTRPFVTWKVAATLDGRVAAADGTSRWVTSAQARAEVHSLRSNVDAIIIGTGTALADDPQLTVRDSTGAPTAGHQPLRVVVGNRRLPNAAKLLDSAAPTLVARTHEPAEVLRLLHEREVQHALLEGGPTLAAAFVRAGLVDAVRWYVAPAILGAGPAALGDAGMRGIGDALRLEVRDVALVGTDVRIDARVPRLEV